MKTPVVYKIGERVTRSHLDKVKDTLGHAEHIDSVVLNGKDLICEYVLDGKKYRTKIDRACTKSKFPSKQTETIHHATRVCYASSTNIFLPKSESWAEVTCQGCVRARRVEL